MLSYLCLSTIIVRENLRKGGIIAQQSQSQRYYCKLFSSVSILRLALQASRRCSSTSKNMPFLHVEDALLKPRKASSSTQPITFWFLEDYELNDYAHTSILQTSYSLCFVMIFHNDVNCLDDTKRRLLRILMCTDTAIKKVKTDRIMSCANYMNMRCIQSDGQSPVCLSRVQSRR